MNLVAANAVHPARAAVVVPTTRAFFTLSDRFLPTDRAIEKTERNGRRSIQQS